MFKKLTVFCCISLAISSCSDHSQKSNVSITGIIPEFTGQRIYVEELEPLGAVSLDSVEVDAAGKFSFHLLIDEAGFYVLHTIKDNSLILLLEEDENVFVSSSESKFSKGYDVEGSPGSGLVLEFEQFMTFQRKRVDSLAFVYNDSRGEEHFMEVKKILDSLYLQCVEDQRNYVFNFIDKYPGSMVNLLVVNRRLGNTQIIDEKKDFIYLYKIDSMLQINYPGNLHTKDHHERVTEIRGEIFDGYVIEEKLRPGKGAPDVVLNDTSGHPVSLKSYTGKQIILYFWAGWDAKSRQMNRKLVHIYSELQRKNIEILGISMDENEVVWKGAIRLDDLQWPQLSDLTGMYSKVKRDYHIPDDLPYFYLIDENQNIKYKHTLLDSILVHLN